MGTERGAPFLALIPAHNEAASLPRVVAELRACWPAAGVLVVDDGSRDDTVALLRTLDVRWLRLHQRLGVGGAMRAGLRYARRLGYTTVVRLDGDGQHQPAQIGRLLAPLTGGAADAVQGSRYAGSAGYHARGLLRLGQRALAALLTGLTRQPVTDPTSGFWAFGPRAVRLLGDHHPSGYGEPELRLFLHRNRLPVVEVPIEMRPRLAGRTSLTPLGTGVALARMLLTAVVVPLRPAVEVSLRE